MKITPLTIECPKCGSGKIAYSCEPECCFNHVCEDCLCNFLLGTRALGRAIPGLRPDAAEKDSCAPTAKCARCESLDVRSLDLDESTVLLAVCVLCGTVLELIYQ